MINPSKNRNMPCHINAGSQFPCRFLLSFGKMARDSKRLRVMVSLGKPTYQEQPVERNYADGFSPKS